MPEDKVFEQEVSLEEMENITGGNGFPNCAGTVEDGSWCERQNACFYNSV